MAKEKRAVVLAGGGARGAYQIGVWQALKKIGYRPDIVAGTSVGALNGAMMVQGDFTIARSLWQNISMEQVLSLKYDTSSLKGSMNTAFLFLRELMQAGGADYSPLKELLLANINEEKVRKSRIEFGFVTVSFPALKPVCLFKEDVNKGELVDYLLASSACFPAMRAHKIGTQEYIDGGYFDNAPIELAIKKGATEIVVVNLDAVGHLRRVDTSGIRIIPISSQEHLGATMVFNAKTSQYNMRLGYLDGLKAFSKLDGMRYSFYLGEAKSIRLAFQDKILSLSKKFGLYPAPEGRGPLGHLSYHAMKKQFEADYMAPFGENFVLHFLETAGMVFGLPKEPVYTGYSFVEELLRRTAKLEGTEHVGFLQSISKLGFTKEAAQKLTDGLDKRHMLQSAAVMLSHPNAAGDVKNKLAFLAAFFPNILCGALALAVCREIPLQKPLKLQTFFRRVYDA